MTHQTRRTAFIALAVVLGAVMIVRAAVGVVAVWRAG